MIQPRPSCILIELFLLFNDPNFDADYIQKKDQQKLNFLMDDMNIPQFGDYL